MPESGTEPRDGEELVLPAFRVIDRERVLAQDELFAVVKDKFPVTPGHTLIIPRRAVKRFRELTEAEQSRLLRWVAWAQDFLTREQRPTPEDFNLGRTMARRPGRRCRSSIFTSSRDEPATWTIRAAGCGG